MRAPSTSVHVMVLLLAWIMSGWRIAPAPVRAEETRCAVLEVYLRGDSPRSLEARRFVEEKYTDRRGVILSFKDVVADPDALNRLNKLSKFFSVAKPGLPSFYVGGRFEVGWEVAVTPQRLEESLTVEVFVRTGCPHCAAARPFIHQVLAPRYPGFRFVEGDLVTSYAARERLQELSRRYGVSATSVPAIHMAGRLLVGFYSAESTGAQWDSALRSVTIPTPEPQPDPASQSRRPNRASPFRLAAWQVTPPSPEPPAGVPLPALAPDSSAAELPADVPPEVPPELPPEVAPRTGAPPPVRDEVVKLPLLGSVNWREWGLPAFTLLVGLIDGFNPCAMWVLLFLLSLLVNLHDRWKILAVAGTFVFISGAAYFAFMAAWLNVFMLVGLFRPAQILLGLIGIVVGAVHVKDFFAFKKGVSLSIPESAKPGIYARMRNIVMAESLWAALVGASVLAVLVNIIELLCTAGLPAMYTGVLAMQSFPWWLNYLYLLLYIIAYMLDDSLMVAVVVVTLGRHKLQERGGRVLKLASGLVIVSLGGVMLFRPSWLV